MIATAVVSDFATTFHCRARLDDVRETDATIPTRVARRMVRVVPGDRILSKFEKSGRATVTGHALRTS